MKIPGAKAGGGGLRGRANSGFSYGCQGRINGEGDGGAEKRAGLKARPYNGDDGGNDYGWAERRAGLPLRLGGLADRKGLPL
jgi:hypothetical protein